ncbi:DUF5979 domain-containing protein [Leucobacter sp. BZR 635]
MLAGGVAALLAGTVMMASGGVVPAVASDGASLMLAKKVKQLDGSYVDAARDLRPGDSVSFWVEFRVNDADADAPVLVQDVLPVEFAGWEITDLTAVVGGSASGITLDLPGVATGPAPEGPVAGIVGGSDTERTISVGVEQRVQSGPANPDGLGMSTRDTGVLEYTLKVPEHLAADDPILRRDLVNTATFSAKAGERELRVSDDAVIAIDNPIRAGVTPSKTWSPEQQGYEPGAASEITIGATQSSNVNASVLRLQDPADPALTPDGATELRAGNPFSAVDFAGFTAPTDPTTNLPTGATTATVEVYRLAAGSWNWVPWDASIPNGEIAGVRTSYAGEIPPGTVVTQRFSATQRATHRTTGESQSQGFAVTNDVRATVEVPGMDPVSADANAPFTVATETIGVDAQKRFLELPNGSETAQLSGVTAGDSVGVVLRATNRDAPASAVLDRLTIAEPAEGSSPLFFGEDLLFAGFDTSVPEAVWPAGASAAELTWRFTDDSEETVALSPHGALPAPAAGKIVAGFELSFTGEIQPGATSEVKYQLDSNPADSFVQPGKKTENLTNAILVTGERGDHEPATATAKATVAFVAPSIETSIQKRVGPGVVTPGQDVIVQLDTVVKTSGGRTQPTEIVVEDVLGDAGTFWDGFDAKQVLPPITRPANNDTPTTQADLTISVQNAAGDWTQLAHNPVDDAPIDIPQGATGIRFVYSNPTGFSQTTLVKPNVSFTARNTLRSDAKTPTATEFTKVVHYENVATVTATGKLGDREVTGTATSKVNAGIRATPGGNGTGPGVGGTLWADKQWAHDTLRSQSGTRTFSTQSWALTKHGFPRVELQDPVSPTASGQGTVFEAFNLTHVRPIHFAGGGANVTQDPMLQWDLVTAVELWDGTAWVPVEAPAAGWMDAKGFTGYALTPEQRESTLGVRLVLGENTAAREAAHDPSDPDLTVPAPGAGVSASGEIRSFGLEWQLRDIARTADGTVKWVKETDTQFNCDGGDGCIDNLFAVTAIPDTGRPATATANDTIQILDGVPNVTLEKQVSALPGGTPGETIGMIAPNPGEVAQEDYPSARYSLTAGNASEAADGAVGRMRLGQIRVTDAAGPNDDSALSIDASPFTGRDFAKESSEQGGNRFNEFTLTGVTFGALPGSIDTAESTVELWLFDGTPAGKTERWTLQQVLDGDPGFAAALPDAIGVSALYSGTDPATHGNRITTSDKLVMHLDVQLRKTERVSGETVTGGQRGSVTSLPNEASVRGWDAVINPEARPTRRDDATIELTQATVEVGLKKSVSVNHTSGSNDTVYESAPDAPVRVELVANPNGSSAPIDTLTVRDTTKAFWDRFELVSFETPTLPEGADRARLQVYVGEKWVSYDGYTGDFSAIHGVGVTFDRNDARTFPQGVASWTGSWKSAKLAVGVKLREGASVNWKSDSVKNLATVVAKNNTFGSAEAEAIDDVRFSPGDHKLRVEKRAPNDTSTHQVEALASAPWKLVFTNTGSSLLPITQVTDALPETLTWDGEDPVVTSVATTGGATELGTAPKVTLSDDGRNLVFDWGKGARMQPGEQVTISLGLIMAPMAAGKRAVNEVIVETGVTLAECVQPTEHGQAPGAVNAPNVCSNTNYVQPRIGTVVGARKTVSGESVPTLGEDLVTGALDTVTGDECRPGNYLPTGSDYTRSPCASYTAIGATDSWKLENINSGTNPLTRMTVVDMLPAPGDRMLAGGAARGSTFAPVLKDLANIRVSGLPEGASYTVEVTENPAACVGTGGDGSLWASDPECADTTANSANQWTPLASFTGAAHNVAGLRFQVDMTAQPLQPGGTILVEFETVNRVLDGAGAAGTPGTSDAALRPTLAQFQEQQFAWNQNGVVGWGPTGVRVNLPAAPQRAGVTVKTDSLTLSKETTGLAQDRAPKSFDIELSCTVPSGSATGPERVALDLGEQARVTVPKNGSVTIDGMPVGADCSVREAGALGSYGENTRAVDLSPGVFPAADGQSADVQIREREGGPIEVLFVNGYAPIPPVPTDKPKPPPEPKNPAPPTSPVLPGEPGSTPTALLPETGGTGFGIFAAAAALVLLLGAALAAAGGARGRRGAHGAAD